MAGGVSTGSFELKFLFLKALEMGMLDVKKFFWMKQKELLKRDKAMLQINH